MQDLLPFVVVGLVSGSVYGIAAMGLVLSYKTSGIFNFAHGAVGAIAAGLFYTLHHQHGWHWALAAIVSVGGMGIVAGLVMERLAYLLADVPMSMKVVGTVGLMGSLSALFHLWHGYGETPFPRFLPQGTVRAFDVAISYDQLIVVGIGIAALAGTTCLLRFTAFGRDTRAVVDSPELFEMCGRSATRVRRGAWLIGSSFASISGILIAPSLGLDATALTLLVVQSFGAASIGRFGSLAWAYVGALGIGLVGAISTKYASAHPLLDGLPTSLPFLVLFAVLLTSKPTRLLALGSANERRNRPSQVGSRRAGLVKIAILAAALCLVPSLVGARLSTWTLGVVYMILVLSLGLVIRTANQVSLCHMSFAAVGAVVFHRLLDAGAPWVPSLVLAGLAVVPIGALIAVPAIRLSGIYLALATLGFGILLEAQVFNTGLMFGQAGTSLPVARPAFATSTRDYYYLVLVVLLLVYGLVRSVERGQLGRLLRARADSSIALASLGSSVRTPSVLIFCVSAFVAGIAGALIGPIFRVVGPTDFLTMPTSLMLVVLLVLNAQSPKVGSLGIAVGAGAGLIIIPGYMTSATMQNQFFLLLSLGVVQAAIAARRDPSATPEPGDEEPPASATPSPDRAPVAHALG